MVMLRPRPFRCPALAPVFLVTPGPLFAVTPSTSRASARREPTACASYQRCTVNGRVLQAGLGIDPAAGLQVVAPLVDPAVHRQVVLADLLVRHLDGAGVAHTGTPFGATET